MKFWSDARGNVAIIFGLVMPCLLLCMGLAVDYAVWTNQKQELQRIADQAALTAASELYMANTSGSQAEAVAKSAATDSMLSAGMATTSDGTGGTDPAAPTSDSPGSSNNATTFGGVVSLETSVDMSEGSVEVIVHQAGVGFFAPMFMSPPIIRVSAVARAMGGGRVCVLALDPTDDKAIILSAEAKLTANQCGVYSNSTDDTGLSAYRNAFMEAELVCSAGGYGGTATNFSPEPVTDCPAMADPLAGRPPPVFGGCDETDLTISGEIRTLSPGVYCGGLGIYNGADIILEPGIYVIKDGPLGVTSTSQIRGENVGFYLTGTDSTFLFAARSVVRLTAPKDGPMAGILFFEDRTVPLLRDYEITSEDAGILTGTIYLPNGRFLVSSKNPIARDSAYTAIVARKIALYRASSIVINSDYSLTDVPVPPGLGTSAVGRTVVLTR